MLIVDEWLRDMPQQFLGKLKIEALVMAFARQLQELSLVFDDMDSKLDLDTAVGQNLDYVGTIIPLTRKEAGELAEIGSIGPVLPDERYRQFLRYMALKNTSECTYYDIMYSIELLWDTKNIRYVEDPSRPATILIDLQRWDIDTAGEPTEGKSLAIRPAGVQLIYTVGYGAVIDESGLEKLWFPKLNIHAHIPFWRCRLFDGTATLNGSEYMNAQSVYNLKFGLQYGAWPIVNPDDVVDLIDVAVHSRIPGEEKLYANKIGIHTGIDFWQSRYLDGSALLDGSLCLGFARQNLPAAVTIKGCVSKIAEDISGGTVIYERNKAFFDGSGILDGSRTLNSIYREEDI